MRQSASLKIVDYVKMAAGASAVSAVLVIASSGPADARPSTRAYTCEGVKDLIYDRGAVVMNTKNSSVYERFVADRSFCQYDEILKYRTVPTKTGRCRLRICKQPIIFKRD